MRYNAGMRALHVGISQVFSLHHLHERESRRLSTQRGTRRAPPWRAPRNSAFARQCLCTAVPLHGSALREHGSVYGSVQGSVQQSSIKGIVHSKVQGSVQGKVQAVSKAADLAVNTAAMYKSV